MISDLFIFRTKSALSSNWIDRFVYIKVDLLTSEFADVLITNVKYYLYLTLLFSSSSYLPKYIVVTFWIQYLNIISLTHIYHRHVILGFLNLKLKSFKKNFNLINFSRNCLNAICISFYWILKIKKSLNFIL